MTLMFESKQAKGRARYRAGAAPAGPACGDFCGAAA